MDRSAVTFSPAEILIGRGDSDNEGTSVFLENRGTAPATITELKTTCGCTVSDQTVPFSLNSGERKRIPITVKLPRHGRKDVYISARFMTPGNAAASAYETQGRLTLDGGREPVPALQRIPPRIVLESSLVESTPDTEFVIATAEPVGPDWNTGAVPDSGNIEVRLMSRSEVAGSSPDVTLREYRFLVSISGHGSLRNGLLDHLEIRFDRQVGEDQSRRSARIPVLLNRTTPVRCVPSELVLRKGIVVPNECVLIASDDRKWDISPVASSSFLEVVSIGAQGTRGQRFRFSVNGQPRSDGEDPETHVRFICTSGNETCEIDMPIVRVD